MGEISEELRRRIRREREERGKGPVVPVGGPFGDPSAEPTIPPRAGRPLRAAGKAWRAITEQPTGISGIQVGEVPGKILQGAFSRLPAPVQKAAERGLKYYYPAVQAVGLPVGIGASALLKGRGGRGAETNPFYEWLPDIDQPSLARAARAFAGELSPSLTSDEKPLFGLGQAAVAAQKELGGGEGFWGGAEVLGELAFTPGMKALGTTMRAAAPRAATTVAARAPQAIRPAVETAVRRGMEVSGSGLELPLKAEMAAARLLTGSVRKVLVLPKSGAQVLSKKMNDVGGKVVDVLTEPPSWGSGGIPWVKISGPLGGRATGRAAGRAVGDYRPNPYFTSDYEAALAEGQIELAANERLITIVSPDNVRGITYVVRNNRQTRQALGSGPELDALQDAAIYEGALSPEEAYARWAADHPEAMRAQEKQIAEFGREQQTIDAAQKAVSQAEARIAALGKRPRGTSKRKARAREEYDIRRAEAQKILATRQRSLADLQATEKQIPVGPHREEAVQLQRAEDNLTRAQQNLDAHNAKQPAQNRPEFLPWRTKRNQLVEELQNAQRARDEVSVTERALPEREDILALQREKGVSPPRGEMYAREGRPGPYDEMPVTEAEARRRFEEQRAIDPQVASQTGLDVGMPRTTPGLRGGPEQGVREAAELTLSERALGRDVARGARPLLAGERALAQDPSGIRHVPARKGPVDWWRMNPNDMPDQITTDQNVRGELVPDGVHPDYFIETGSHLDYGRRLARQPVLKQILSKLAPGTVARKGHEVALWGWAAAKSEGDRRAAIVMSTLRQLGTFAHLFGELNQYGLVQANDKLIGGSRSKLVGMAPNTIRQKRQQLVAEGVLTKGQSMWLETAHRITEGRRTLLERAGINIKMLTFETGGDFAEEYADRRVWGRVHDEHGDIVELGFSGTKQRPGREAGYEKPRHFTDAEEAIKAGYRYMAPEEEIYMNLRAAYNSVTNEQFLDTLVRRLKDDGIDLTRGERGVGKTPIEQLQQTRLGVEDAKALKAIENSLNANTSDIITSLNKFNALSRVMKLAGDASPFAIQLLFVVAAPVTPGIGRRAGWRVWKEAFRGFTDAFRDAGAHDRLITTKRDVVTRNPGLILSRSPAGNEQTAALRAGGLLHHTNMSIPGRALRPISKILAPFQRAFDMALDAAGIALVEAMEPIVTDPRLLKRYGTIQGMTPEQMLNVRKQQMVGMVNQMRGLSDSAALGTSAKTRQIETLLLLAPRYGRAIASMLWDVTQGMAQVQSLPGVGPAIAKRLPEWYPSYYDLGGLRAEYTRNFVASSVAAMSAINVLMTIQEYLRKTDNPNWDDFLDEAAEHFNPTSHKFFTWDIAGINMGPGTKVRSMVKLFGQLVSDPEKFTDSFDSNPGLRFVLGQGSPVVGEVWKWGSGYTFMGERIHGLWDDDQTLSESINNGLEDWTGTAMTLMRHGLAENLMPLWVYGSLFENGFAQPEEGMDWREHGKQRLILAAANFWGLRAYPKTRMDMQNDIARELFPETPTWDELNQRQKEEVEQATQSRFGSAAYRYKSGQWYKDRDKAEAEYISKLQTVGSEYLQKPTSPSVEEWAKYKPGVARQEMQKEEQDYYNFMHGSVWDEEKGRLVMGHYDDPHSPYRDEAFEEPEEEGSPEHDIWVYHNLFDRARILGSDGLPTEDIDYHLLQELRGKFWAERRGTRANAVLNNIRNLENKFPDDLQRFEYIGRFIGVYERNIDGTNISWWQLDEHPDVMRYIRKQAGVTDDEIKEFREFTSKEKNAFTRIGEDEKWRLIQNAEKELKKRTGLLTRKRNQFFTEAMQDPNGMAFLQAMVEGGYELRGLTIDEEDIRDTIRDNLGGVMKDYDYEQLYRTAIGAHGPIS